MKNFHILKLEASNIKGIKAVVIEPKPGVVSIEGKNGDGKTSALDAIEMAVRGKRYCPSQPIRQGQKKGTITLELGNHISKDVDLIIKRIFTERGSSITVTNGEGLEYKSPQAMLDQLCGAMAFDPMEFTRMDAAKRSETLKKLAGLNFDDIERRYKNVFESRTIVNRKVKELESSYVNLKDYHNVIVPNISEVEKERTKAIESNHEIDRVHDKVENKKETLKRYMEEIEGLESRISGLRRMTTDINTEVFDLEKSIENNIKQDLSKYDNAISNYAELAKESQNYESRINCETLLTSEKELSETLTKGLQDLLKEKGEMLRGAKLPVEGLDFANGDVTFKGIEFEQINTAEKIKISMCMAMALNPRLKIVRIMNGSLVDSNGMAEIEKLSKENGFDIWIEKVSSEKTSDNSFLITEGMIVE